jgi:hypothetical protein
MQIGVSACRLARRCCLAFLLLGSPLIGSPDASATGAGHPAATAPGGFFKICQG